jgi:ClpP class serine protease
VHLVKEQLKSAKEDERVKAVILKVDSPGGEVLEVTESRISQLHTKAILRLRAKLSNIKKGIL